jgi:hypothetical protein
MVVIEWLTPGKRSVCYMHRLHCRIPRRDCFDISNCRRYSSNPPSSPDIQSSTRPDTNNVSTLGQYHWVAALCPSSSRSTASFITGWISVGGQIVLTASAAFAAGLQTQALIVLNEDSYGPTRWQGMLFYWAILIYAMAINIWGSKLLPTANLISGENPHQPLFEIKWLMC